MSNYVTDYKFSRGIDKENFTPPHKSEKQEIYLNLTLPLRLFVRLSPDRERQSLQDIGNRICYYCVGISSNKDILYYIPYSTVILSFQTEWCCVTETKSVHSRTSFRSYFYDYLIFHTPYHHACSILFGVT